MTQSFAYMLPDRFMVVLTDFSFSNIIALGTRLKSRTFAAGSFPRNHEKSYRVTTNLLSCPYRCYCFPMASFPSSAYGWNNCVCFLQMEFRGLLWEEKSLCNSSELKFSHAVETENWRRHSSIDWHFDLSVTSKVIKVIVSKNNPFIEPVIAAR